MPGWHGITLSTLAARKVASSVAALNALFTGAKPDGTLGAIKVGAWPNEHMELLEWDATAAKWIGEQQEIITQGDVWAMDLRDKSGVQLVAYAPCIEAVPFGSAMAILNGAHNLAAAAFNPGTATGVITVDSLTTAGHGIPFLPAGNIRIRDNIIVYAALAGDTQFTGCKVMAGSRENIPDNLVVSQGHPGGFGFVVSPIVFAGELYAAGLRLQEKMFSHMNGSTEGGGGTKALSLAPYWYQYNDGDGAPGTFAAPPAGGLGTSTPLVGTTEAGGVDNNGERNFFMHENDWSDFPAFVLTKRYLVPKMYGKMTAGAIDTGECLDTVLRTRWVG